MSSQVRKLMSFWVVFPKTGQSSEISRVKREFWRWASAQMSSIDGHGPTPTSRQQFRHGDLDDLALDVKRHDLAVGHGNVLPKLVRRRVSPQAVPSIKVLT